MTFEKFNEIWENIFKPTMAEIDTEHICRLKLNAINKVYVEYQTQRKNIHENCMENYEGYIDRHKVAACLMCAIEKIQPVFIPFSIKFKLLKENKKLSRQLSYINEYLAFYSAISILDAFYDDDEKQGKVDRNRKRIIIPNTFNNDYGYVFDFCLDLYFGKQRNMLNILTYANILFLLEYEFNPKEELDK